MTVYREPFPKIGERCVLALGTFDGVHIGHSAVIDRAVGIARRLRVKCLVWCFRDLPRNYFLRKSGGSPIPLICTPSDKIDLIAARGADIIVETDADGDLLSLLPGQFIDEIVAAFDPVHVVVGFNYTFGSRSEGIAGNCATLCELLGARGIGVDVVEPVNIDGAIVSSTMIREKIEHGEFDVEHLLGRRYSISVPPESVMRDFSPDGDDRDRTCDSQRYPIAIRLVTAAPPDGIYSVKVRLPDEKSEFNASDARERATDVLVTRAGGMAVMRMKKAPETGAVIEF